jgi:hypothetical protein
MSVNRVKVMIKKIETIQSGKLLSTKIYFLGVLIYKNIQDQK